MLLAIDLGNTAVKIGHEDAFGVLRVFRSRHGERSIGELLGLALDQSASNPFVRLAAVASVAPQYHPELEDALHTFGVAPRYLNSETVPGLTNHYRTPETLGADRLANALYLSERTDGPAVSVDFGTATKLDVVDAEGAFLGGAILPSARMMMDALARGTAQLSAVPVRPPPSAIGTNTVECLQSGTVFALAKAVEGLLEAFRSELGSNVAVIGTGGDLDEMAPLCPSLSRREPNLTLEGLFIAARRWASSD